MDLNKSKEFFNPNKIKDEIHLIGCGAVGSSIGELLARAGIEKINIWDMDIVAPHNIANQMFLNKHIGKLKTDCLEEIIKEINPETKVVKHKEWTPHSALKGYIFLCVDNIDLRRHIVELNKYNPNIKIIFDTRIGLTEAIAYTSEWNDTNKKEEFLRSMQYTHEEAKQNTPISACGFELSVAPTIRVITSYQIANFMNYVNTGSYKKMINTEAYKFLTEAYEK